MEVQPIFSRSLRSRAKKALKKIFFVLCLTGFSAQAENLVYKKYFFDTFRSLSCLRAPSGLIHDKRLYIKESFSLEKPFCGLHFLNEDTSPTNIGLDILVQTEALVWPELRKEALSTLKLIFQTLLRTPYDPQSGLFFSRYLTGDKPQVVARDISSVDNIHLALAFWTVSEQFRGTALGEQASKLFRRMDFSLLYDKSTGLMYGGATWQNNRWVTSGWTYRFFGSESRSISSLGWSLGLFKDKEFIDKFFSSAEFELYFANSETRSQPILKTWDGGAFQLLLPEILIKESQYSLLMNEIFNNYSSYILRQGRIRSLPVPAAHSASEYGVEGTSLCSSPGACYSGKAGSLDLISEKNSDRKNEFLRAQWQSVYTSHAALMASVFDPSQYLRVFLEIENLGMDGYSLYIPDLGWMDGLIVEGIHKGRVIHALLSLDQGMAALALARILSADKQTTSSRMLKKNFQTRKFLQIFYNQTDLVLKTHLGFEKF